MSLALVLLLIAGPLDDDRACARADVAELDATTASRATADTPAPAKPRHRIFASRPDHVAMWWWGGAGTAGALGILTGAGAGGAGAFALASGDATTGWVAAALAGASVVGLGTGGAILLLAPWSAPGCDWMEGRYNFPGTCAPCAQPRTSPCPCAPGPPACRHVLTGELRAPDEPFAEGAP